MSDLFIALKHWAKSGPADDFWLWAIGLLNRGNCRFLLISFMTLHRKRIIEDTPTSKIRSAAQGYVELVGYGQLMEGQPIVAHTLTGTICTWYDYSVDEHQTSPVNVAIGSPIKSGTSDRTVS